jgi:hypothetical protein
MREIRKFVNKRHRLKWGALSGLLGCGTALLQYIPQSWPSWVGIGLTVVAFVVAGVSQFVEPEHA